MALATISVPPGSPESFFIWAQAHAAHHYDCIRVAGAQFAKQFDQYILDPFDPQNMYGWLDRHEDMHNQMNRVLSVAGSDLSTLEWGDINSVQTWFSHNYTEHQNWGSILNLG